MSTTQKTHDVGGIEISTVWYDGVDNQWEAKANLPYPFQTQDGGSTVFGHGRTRQGALRAALAEYRDICGDRSNKDE